MRPIFFEEEAKAELRQSAKQYDQQKPGLGREFTAEIDAALDYIGRHPYEGLPPTLVRRALASLALALIWDARTTFDESEILEALRSTGERFEGDHESVLLAAECLLEIGEQDLNP